MYLHRTHRVASSEKSARRQRPKYVVLLLAVSIVVVADAATTVYDLGRPGLEESGLLVSHFVDSFKTGHYWYVAFLPEFIALAAVMLGAFVLVRALRLNENYAFVSLVIPVLVVLNNVRLGLVS